MKARIKWLDHMTLVAESGSGHAIVADAAPEVGGRDIGARPMELVLLGLGSCTAIDVLQILRKARQAVTDCEIQLEAERADQVPQVFTRIHLHYLITGTNLSEQQVQRAVSLSAEKYCSVSKMLEKTATITHDYELLAAEATQ